MLIAEGKNEIGNDCGLLKEIHKELNLYDAEDGDLIHIDDETDEIANGAMEVRAYWHVGVNYVIRFK